jgi:two-component system nitrogen regulation sensor histidine kinase GlnL
MAAQPSLLASVMADSNRILDSLSTSVLIVDRERSLLSLTVSAETLFGVSRNQVRGRPLAELLHDSKGLDAVIDRAATTSRPFSRRELALRPIYGDGELVVDCTVAPFDESGTPGAVVIEISDAT